MTVICEFGIVGLGWAESGSIEGAIAGGSRPLQVVDSFFLLSPKGPLLALVEQQDSQQQQQPAPAAAEEEEEGKRGRQGTVGHSAGGGCTVQEGPVRFSNSNSIAAIKEQPGQSRRGKAGTICWWRRRESWEWIGPTATGGDSVAVCLFCCCGCWCCYRNKRAQVLSLLSQYWQDWTLLAGGQRFGSTASRSARTVRQPASRWLAASAQDMEKNGLNGRPLHTVL